MFFITGSLGFVWAWIWLKLYQPPAKNRFITPEERQHIATSLEAPTERPEPIPWLRLFTYRQVWGLIGAKFITDSAWYFYILWLQK